MSGWKLRLTGYFLHSFFNIFPQITKTTIPELVRWFKNEVKTQTQGSYIFQMRYFTFLQLKGLQICELSKLEKNSITRLGYILSYLNPNLCARIDTQVSKGYFFRFWRLAVLQPLKLEKCRVPYLKDVVSLFNKTFNQEHGSPLKV